MAQDRTNANKIMQYVHLCIFFLPSQPADQLGNVEHTLMTHSKAGTVLCKVLPYKFTDLKRLAGPYTKSI